MSLLSRFSARVCNRTWYVCMFQVCYGMVYGIGAKALGEQLDVDENDAAVFMETFKARYTGLIHMEHGLDSHFL